MIRARSLNVLFVCLSALVARDSRGRITTFPVVIESQRRAAECQRKGPIMKFARCLVTLGIVFIVYPGAADTHQGAAAPQRPALTAERMEAFLLKARITRLRDQSKGVSIARRATLVEGSFTHDAHIQFVDTERPVVDLWRYNIAGYRLARLLGMDNVPVSVERQVEGKRAAVTWWIDDVKMDEKERLRQKATGPDPGRMSLQIQVMRVFDELIENRDRNQGNILWTSDWKMWLIDHTRAFRWGKGLLKPDELTRCERRLLGRMRGLTAESIARVMGDAMTKPELIGLLARRDLIVKHFDDRIAKYGEAAVLFTLE